MRCWSGFILAALYTSVAACAAPTSGNVAPLTPEDTALDVYAKAFAAGQHGFSCLPASHIGGPARSEFLREQSRLRERRLALRAHLVQKYGAEALDAIEQQFFEELQTVYFVEPCKYAPADRRQYRRLLAKLESMIVSGTY